MHSMKNRAKPALALALAIVGAVAAPLTLLAPARVQRDSRRQAADDARPVVSRFTTQPPNHITTKGPQP